MARAPPLPPGPPPPRPPPPPWCGGRGRRPAPPPPPPPRPPPPPGGGRRTRRDRCGGGAAHRVVAARSRGPRQEPRAAGVLLAPRVEVGRAAVGPARSLGLRHRRSFPRFQPKKGPARWGAGRGFVSVVYTLTPPVRSRLGE